MKKLLLLARGLEAENNFDLEEYKNGVYFLKIKNDNRLLTITVIIKN